MQQHRTMGRPNDVAAAIANAQAIVARHTSPEPVVLSISYRSRKYMECDSRESIFWRNDSYV